jgi:DNA-binding MarR family transcriptional regulator
MAELLSASEWRLLYALDDLTYADSEDGGDGWVEIWAVAEDLGVRYHWASLLLRTAWGRGFAERRSHNRRGRCRLCYALSEAGADLVRPVALPSKPRAPEGQG